MYPLNAVLIGCGDFSVGRSETLRAQVRRELSNLLACVRTEFADVTAAIERFQLGPDEPVLFLVYLRSLDDLAQLPQLAARFPGQPILGLRDARSDQQLFRGALRAGASFAIPVPLEPTDLQAALEWIGREYGFVPRQTPVVAVAGVTGGAGATTLALNLAYEAAVTLERRCILAEAALRLGVLATYLEVEPRFTIHHLLEDLEGLDIDLVRSALTPVVPNLDLLSGPQHAIQPRPVQVADLARVIHYARPLADLIVVDVPCTYDDLFFQLLAAADQVVLVMEQKLASVRAVQMVRDSLRRDGAKAEQQRVVVSRYDPRVPGFRADELARHLGLTAVPRTVANDFASVSGAIHLGLPLRKHAPASPVLADIENLLRSLLDLRERPQAEKPGAFRRLVHAFGLR